jgi:putative MATE family efflux protein
MINDLTTGSVWKKLIVFALPFMLSSAFQTLYSTVDMIIVGQWAGGVGLSAVATASSINMFVTSIGMGFATGGQIVISQLVGADKRDKIKQTIGTLLSTLAVLAVFFGSVAAILSAPLLHLLNAPDEAFAGARQYLVINAAGAILTYGYNAVSAILRGMGDSKRPLIFIAIASVINLVLDYVFVALCGFGVAGAAIATVIGQGVAFAVAIVYLVRHRDAFMFDFKPSSFKPDRDTLKVLVKLGTPMALQSCSIDLSMSVINGVVNTYGVAASAAYGVGIKIDRFTAIATHALWTGGATMVGQNVGAGKYDRATKTVYTSMLICTIFCGCFAVIYALFPRQLFGLFTSDSAVLDLAWTYLLTSVIQQPASILATSCNSVIEGTGNAGLSLAIALFDGIVLRIALSLLLGNTFGLGLFGFFLGNNLAMYGTAIPAAIYFWSGMWKKRKLLVDKV